MGNFSGLGLLAAILLGSGSLLAGIGGDVSPARAPSQSGSSPVLLELFTSQGCSSCPPADRLAERLAKESGVVVITRPVTYWDRLGWKDTLASPVNTQLQQDYDAHRLPDGGVFTPELVVDGQGAAVGSDEHAIRRLIEVAAVRSKPAIAAVNAPGRGRAIGLAGAAQGESEVVLAALTGQARVRIGSGENGGRMLSFTNVFRGERLLGHWRGGTASFPIPQQYLRHPLADRYAVVVRKAAGGPVLAALLLSPG